MTTETRAASAADESAPARGADEKHLGDGSALGPSKVERALGYRYRTRVDADGDVVSYAEPIEQESGNAC